MKSIKITSSLAYLAISLSVASAFGPIGGLSGQTSRQCTSNDQLPTFRTTRGSTVETYLFRKIFRRDKKDGEDGNADVIGDADDETPFFAQEQASEVVPVDSVEPLQVATEPSFAAPVIETTTPGPVVVPPPAPKPVAPPPPPKPLSPQEQAEQLRAAAERTRLEAEKMEAVLSLEKITKLEKELGSKAVENDADRAAQIRRDIDSLKRKLNGEEVAPVPAPRPVKSVESESKTAADAERSVVAATDRSSLVTATAVLAPEKKSYEPLPAIELQERVQKYEQSPKFMREIVARTAGIDFMDVSEVNATALVVKLHEDELKYLDIEKSVAERNQGNAPNFSQEQIDAKVKELENVPQFVKNLYGKDAKNDTAIALQMLQTEYESDNMKRQLMRAVEEMEEGSENTREGPTLSPTNKPTGGSDEVTSGSTLFGAVEEKSEMERMMESLYPKSTRKEGTMPSQAQTNILMADVMTKIKRFSPSGKPEEVPGGYIIRGTSEYESGQELIDAIDSALEKSRVREQLLVHFVADPTPVTEDQLMIGERPPVLYVTSTDIAREGNRFVLAGVTSVAIGTAWYNSLYPFLLNPSLLKSSEEQLNLANAGMEYDLNFLTDMAIPLFAAFMGTQVVHEAAHWAVASSKKMEITFPTLVPSLVTGVTSSITALKKSPKNKQDLFDFAIVGPLAGIVASCALLFVGCGITATLDSTSYAQLPALPLVVLRQSALAGGIIEYVLGDGMLSVPASAAGTAALADVNISLHPFAIAGFFGLVVNAINLVPFGRTDGGRVSLALFGRSGSQAAGFFALIALFFQGIFSSDLLLFYFAFMTFFQSESEIPCRNEVDDIDFSRVLLSTFAGVLVLLSIIPMD